MDTQKRQQIELLPSLHPELPQAVQSEQATLGAILLNRDAMFAVNAWLTPDMFYYERHAHIYTAMLDLSQRRIPPDTRTVSEELRRRDRLDAVGGVSYLSDLVDMVPTSYHIEHYARPVEQAARRRRLIRAGSQIAALGYSAELTEDAADAEAHTLLTQATARQSADDLVSADVAVGESWDHLNSEAPACTLTHFADLDDKLGGLQGGDFVLIAARPSVGKTSFALSLVRNFSQANQPCLIFSLEMSRLQLTQRLISMQSGVETRILRTRAVCDETTLQRLGDAHGVVSRWPWTICDLSAQTPLQIRARTMRHLATYPDSVILLDYIGLMASDSNRENRTQEVSALSLALKSLARDANVPIIALCQLSRAVEGRAEHRPMLSDLRDSGSLEQDADAVLFLYRDELYNPHTDAKGLAELIIGKNRNGPIGTVQLRFDAQTTRFDTLTWRTPEGYDHANND